MSLSLFEHSLSFDPESVNQLEIIRMFSSNRNDVAAIGLFEIEKVTSIQTFHELEETVKMLNNKLAINGLAEYEIKILKEPFPGLVMNISGSDFNIENEVGRLAETYVRKAMEIYIDNPTGQQSNKVTLNQMYFGAIEFPIKLKINGKAMNNPVVIVFGKKLNRLDGLICTNPIEVKIFESLMSKDGASNIQIILDSYGIWVTESGLERLIRTLNRNALLSNLTMPGYNYIHCQGSEFFLNNDTTLYSGEDEI